MLQPQIFEVGEKVTFLTLGTDFAKEYGVEDVVGIVDTVKRTFNNSKWTKITDWVYEISVEDFHGKPYVFREMEQCLIRKLNGHNIEPCKYECGQIVCFGDKELVGEIVVVDNRYHEYSTYACDWSYDILVDSFQGSPCIFKHIPEYEVLEVLQ